MNGESIDKTHEIQHFVMTSKQRKVRALQLTACFALSCAETTPPPDVPSTSHSLSEPATEVYPSTASGAPSADAPRTPPVGTGLTPEQVRAVVRTSIGAVQACYGFGLARDPSLEGAVVISALAAPDGTVSKATAVYPEPDPATRSPNTLPPTTLQDAAVVECILRVFRRLRFPTAEKATGFVFPMVFRGKPSTTPASSP